ncbi:helix-turn-helix domain-containing protein [Vibrio mimicus]|uniref:helix-turn-helix domain-containing protein n=1 Tax=Vibrio mimicus TaxID=674 RepID=UPI0013024AD5|nr:helix-turn-helix transcriptional regulator [Vibrio mimicus]
MFSSKIRDLRVERELNQEEVANGIGVGKNTYLAYEKGTQSPKLETVEKLAKFYGVPIAELVSDSETNIDEKLKSKIRMIESLDEPEKESLFILMEALLMRSKSREIQKEFR